MDDVEFYERFEPINETVEKLDQRWRVWDRIENCYLPGHWDSSHAAWLGAKQLAAQGWPKQGNK